MKILKAKKEHIETIVQMLSDDQLGSQRENFKLPLPTSYFKAFEKIDSDPNQYLAVALSDDDKVIGTMQLTFITYLTYQGGTRAQIEAVRIKKDQRGTGLGREMIKWAIEKAKEMDAHVIQLTTDKLRPEAMAFYESLDFKATHEGMKLHLNILP